MAPRAVRVACKFGARLPIRPPRLSPLRRAQPLPFLPPGRLAEPSYEIAFDLAARLASTPCVRVRHEPLRVVDTQVLVSDNPSDTALRHPRAPSSRNVHLLPFVEDAFLQMRAEIGSSAVTSDRCSVNLASYSGHLASTAKQSEHLAGASKHVAGTPCIAVPGPLHRLPRRQNIAPRPLQCVQRRHDVAPRRSVILSRRCDFRPFRWSMPPRRHDLLAGRSDMLTRRFDAPPCRSDELPSRLRFHIPQPISDRIREVSSGSRNAGFDPCFIRLGPSPLIPVPKLFIRRRKGPLLQPLRRRL